MQMGEMEKHTAGRGQAEKAIKQTAFVGIAGNIFLAVFKLFAGIAGHSSAMVSDAVHTCSDIFATAIAFFGVKMGGKAADHEHPYGHERLECVASVILGGILVSTGLGIGLECARAIWSGSYLSAEKPGMLAAGAAVVSIAVKEGMFWYTLLQAKKIGSSAFRADAWHHRSDAISSVGALAGILGAMLGYPILDPLAGIGICFAILHVALGILKDAIDKMVDTACSSEFEEQVRSIIEGAGVSIDKLLTRKFGEKAYIDAEIRLDGAMPLREAHAIAESLHDRIEKEIPSVKHIMIHVNPTDGRAAS